jgi:hypothetical protein
VKAEADGPLVGLAVSQPALTRSAQRDAGQPELDRYAAAAETARIE